MQPHQGLGDSSAGPVFSRLDSGAIVAFVTPLRQVFMKALRSARFFPWAAASLLQIAILLCCGVRDAPGAAAAGASVAADAEAQNDAAISAAYIFFMKVFSLSGRVKSVSVCQKTLHIMPLLFECFCKWLNIRIVCKQAQCLLALFACSCEQILK
jgi:hypothetical protein